MSTEAPEPGSAGLNWIKSSHSGGNGGECVEVASTVDAVLVRDSKDKEGPRLAFAREGWAEFLRFAAEQ